MSTLKDFVIRNSKENADQAFVWICAAIVSSTVMKRLQTEACAISSANIVQAAADAVGYYARFGETGTTIDFQVEVDTHGNNALWLDLRVVLDWTPKPLAFVSLKVENRLSTQTASAVAA